MMVPSENPREGSSDIDEEWKHKSVGRKLEEGRVIFRGRTSVGWAHMKATGEVVGEGTMKGLLQMLGSKVNGS